jgi:uncharacterized protein with HEPN domain
MPPEDRLRLLHMIEAADFDIDVNVVWKAATEELPELLPKLRALTGKE